MIAILAAAAVSAVSLPCLPEGVTTHRVQVIARELVVKASVDRPVYECVLAPEVMPIPVMLTTGGPDGGLLFIVSRQFEDNVSEAALRGAVGHEVGHLAERDHDNAFWRELTEQQKLDREAQADVIAAVLVGREAILAAIDEFSALIESSLAGTRNRLTAEMAYRKERLTKPPGPQDPR